MFTRVFRLLTASALTAATLILPTPTAAQADWFAPETRLTSNSAFQRWPSISGNKVVFEDYRYAHDVGDPNDPTTLYDIRVVDLTTRASKNLTPYHTAVTRPDISGNWVVWGDYGHGSLKGGLYAYNLASGVRRRLPVSGGEIAISGTRVAYEYSNRIYVHDIVTGGTRRITPPGASAGAPDISGLNVVWQDFRDGNHEIYSYNLATRVERRLTNHPGRQTLPRISGNHVVWIDDRNGLLNDDIYLFDLASGTEKQITSAPGTQWFPAVSGNLIAWTDERDGDSEIYLHDLVSGVEKRVTTNAGWQGNVALSGDRVVWEDHLRPGPESDNMDIYLTRITRPTLGVSVASAVDHDTAVPVTGTLKSATGVPLPGRTVFLDSSVDNARWAEVGSATTAADGGYLLTSAPLTERVYLRVRFTGDAGDPGCVSASRLVKARLFFAGAPEVPSAVQSLGATQKVTGWFLPKHSSGSHQIVLRAYRYQKGSDGRYHWVYKRSYSTTTANPSGASLTKYGGYVKLPYRGQWRLRAYHAADYRNATSYSPYAYVIVR